MSKYAGLVLILGLLLAAALLFGTRTQAQDGGYRIDWSKISGGGGTLTGGDYTARTTDGQADAGDLRGGSYTLQGGFQDADLSQALTPLPTTLPHGQGYQTYLPLTAR